jgi:hypothetical protein
MTYAITTVCAFLAMAVIVGVLMRRLIIWSVTRRMHGLPESALSSKTVSPAVVAKNAAKQPPRRLAS